MTAVQTPAGNKAGLAAEARRQLVKNAVECTFYVALGKCMARELAESFGLTPDEAGNILSVEACKLVDHIREVAC